jgi:hypothetical protein
VKVDGRSGDETIYRTPPDRQALEFLIEHGLGKVPQRHEITGEEGGALTIIPWLPPSVKVKELPEGEEEVIDAEAETVKATEGN